MGKQYFLSILLFFLPFVSNAQTSQKKWTFSGYLSNMQSAIIDSLQGNWVNDNLIHNRLIFNYYPTQNIIFNVEVRNRIMTGETGKYMPNYAENMSKDLGIIDLNRNLIAEKSILVNTQIDRLNLSFEKESFNLIIGRQRINWGRSFVWNPNDIFNTYSFFDFDYPEHIGADAIRLQYFTGAASTVELVAKTDSTGKVTGAGLCKTNIKSFDFQVIGGIINEEKFVIGTGWEGYIKSVSFRGEMSYVQPKKNFTDTIGTFIADISFDYTFKNSLMIQLEMLWNKKQNKTSYNSFSDMYTQPTGIENLSFSEFSIFTATTYPVTPLTNLTFSAIYYPSLNGFFAGPNISYSVVENLDITATAQYFHTQIKILQTGNTEKFNISLVFLRLKYNF